MNLGEEVFPLKADLGLQFLSNPLRRDGVQSEHRCRIRSGSAQLFRSGGNHLTGCGANRLRGH